MARKKQFKWKQIFHILPLFFTVLIFYDFLAFMPGPMQELLIKGAFPAIKLPSGVLWYLTIGEVFILFSIIILFFELIKATKTRMGTSFEHIFSAFVFIGFLLHFILYNEAATGVFFLIMMFSLLDLVAGFTITISQARRDVSYGG